MEYRWYVVVFAYCSLQYYIIIVFGYFVTLCRAERRPDTNSILLYFFRAGQTVKEEDLIKNKGHDDLEADDSMTKTGGERNQEMGDADNLDDGNYDHIDDIETGEHDNSIMSFEDDETGQLKLGDATVRLVPNCCAVCLSEYRVGDVVTWSSNRDCTHAFHRECVVGWLIKMQPETPCPCCRQEFTDLEEIRKEQKIKWLGTFAFDFNAVRLR